MALFETGSGKRLTLNLPDTAWPELQQVVDSYRDLLRERKATSARIGQLRAVRSAAVGKDRQALADAIAAGEPDPGEKNTEQIDKEDRACRRRLDALELALDEIEQRLAETVDEHRDEWNAEMNAALDQTQAEYAEAVEALSQAHEKVSRVYSLRAWVRRFPETLKLRTRDSRVPLKSPTGDDFAFEKVLVSLREHARPFETVKVPEPERVE